ncbi:transmembrane protein 43 [Coregonus clupeaformis]|uniref:transmembrane protein 43 n=1 Tax=Coregonus clupeaformis TaxID=59861 RepID=UPI001BE0FF03|nr:transmembrane protein 43 [Coregonus clupeaformis]
MVGRGTIQTMSASTLSAEHDQHTRTTSRSKPGFLERLSETAGGTVLGVTLFALSFYVLFTNEGRALRTATSLDEGLSQVVSLHLYSSPLDHNNNHLVHLTAPLRTLQPLHDPNYRVAVQAVKLKRQVEMYQWVEYSESRDYDEGGESKTETTYNYNTEWKAELINSRNFDKEIGHINPSAMAVESVTVVTPDVQVGPFSLSKGLVDQIENFQTLRLKDLPAPDSDSFLTVDEDYFYHTQHPRRPEVGDVRVSFSYAGLSGEGSYPGPAQTVSVVAMQSDDTLKPFRTKSGDILEIIYLEELTAEEVFEREQKNNAMLTWALRAGGWLLMFLGISLMIRIIHTLVDWVPILRELISLGLKLFALCVSCSLSLLTISSGWIFYRPLVAVGLIAMAVIPIVIARSRAPAKKHQ